MQKGILNSATIFIIATMMVLQSSPVFAQMSTVPECQFTAQPTPEMMERCNAAAAAASGSSMPSSMPTSTMAGPEGMPDLSSFDFSKFGPVPEGVEGGVAPMFMGKELMGGGTRGPGAGELGNALEQIKSGLEQAEEGIAEMKEGQIKIDPAMESGVKNARPIYNEAIALFEAGDYKATAQKLQELQAVGFDKKYAAFAETQGVSLDLVKDIRARIADALKTAEKNAPADEIMQIKGDILTQQKYLNEVESLIKAGKKKEASAILKKMRQEYGDGEAQAGLLSGKAMPASKLASVLAQIAAGVDRAGSGMEKAKDSGTEIPEEIASLNEKIKEIYIDAKKAFDEGDNETATQKVKEIRDLNPEETFTAFRDKVYPEDRLAAILKEGKDGAKGLVISIERVREFGGETDELEKLSVQLEDLIAKAEAALAKKDTDLFLTYMDQARQLKTREKVDAVINRVTEGSRKEILAKGLDAVRAAITSLESAVPELTKKKGNVATAQALLTTARQKTEQSQNLYNTEEYKKGGYVLDDAVLALTKLANLLKDSGVSITNEQNNAVVNVVQRASDSASFDNLSSDASAKAKGVIGTGGQNGFELQSTLGAFDPALMEKVIAYRSSDKKIIDGVINDVVPLLPEEDREAILEGKIGLLDETKAADKTLRVIKGIKGVSKETLTSMTSLTQQTKGYNFTPEIAEKLQGQLMDFNDKIQSGELKDPKGIDGYVQAIKDQVSKSMAASSGEKFKEKLIPARNIDDNNPLFDEIQYLRQDGAVAPDKNGNINLDQKIDKSALASLINKTIDKNVVGGGRGAATIQDIMKAVMGAYKVNPGVNLNNAAQATKFFSGIGADVNASNFKKQATMKDAAEIIQAADQRWGIQN